VVTRPAVVLLALTTPGCLAGGSVTLHLAPPRLVCYDGIPARLFLDPHCPSGVCGYTCSPNRWTLKETTP
jgi:hypothetical protein